MNKNNERRNEILGFTSEPEYRGGCFGVEISLERLELLVAENFIELDECQNYSPDTQTFLEFLRCHPSGMAHGYIISPERGDYRVTLEGLRYEAPSQEDLDNGLAQDFIDAFRNADDFTCDLSNNVFYCWWD